MLGFAVALVILIALTMMFLSSLLYIWRGWFVKLFHDKLEWHRPDERGHIFDLRPGSMDIYGHAYCKHCGKRIIPASDYGDWMVSEWQDETK